MILTLRMPRPGYQDAGQADPRPDRARRRDDPDCGGASNHIQIRITHIILLLNKIIYYIDNNASTQKYDNITYVILYMYINNIYNNISSMIGHGGETIRTVEAPVRRNMEGK